MCERTEYGFSGAVSRSVVRTGAHGTKRCEDLVAVEEPLEIRLGFEREGRRQTKALSITMRTPGNDFELAAGFLFSEGIVRERGGIANIRYCGRPAPDTGHRNTVLVELADGLEVKIERLERHFYTTSSCGVCGKSSLDALEPAGCTAVPRNTPPLPASLLYGLPAALRSAQPIFEQTGGLHASALFDFTGKLLCLREDVGRHNALDKLVGVQLLEGVLPLSGRVLLVSGRASFELVQKAAMAGIPIMAAVGAPSSLAVELAERFGITLAGFLKEERFNLYSHPERILTD